MKLHKKNLFLLACGLFIFCSSSHAMELLLLDKKPKNTAKKPFLEEELPINVDLSDYKPRTQHTLTEEKSSLWQTLLQPFAHLSAYVQSWYQQRQQAKLDKEFVHSVYSHLKFFPSLTEENRIKLQHETLQRIQTLLQAKANPETPIGRDYLWRDLFDILVGETFIGQPALYIALNFQRDNLVRLLVKHKADLHNGPNGDTPLRTALGTYYDRDHNNVFLLLENGCDIRKSDYPMFEWPLTWYKCAEESRLKLIRKSLFEHGAKILVWPKARNNSVMLSILRNEYDNHHRIEDFNYRDSLYKLLIEKKSQFISVIASLIIAYIPGPQYAKTARSIKCKKLLMNPTLNVNEEVVQD